MNRAVILSSGAGWAAYQIGALRYLIEDRGLRFSVCAGTGIGAMNAALMACHEFQVLRSAWRSMGWSHLVRPNYRHPWKDAPMKNTPQRQFIQKHVSERKLEKTGNTLIFSALDLRNGKEKLFTYPGANLPLIDALMGAVALPGLTAPHRAGRSCLVEGSFVNTFILNRVIRSCPADAYYGIGILPAGSGLSPGRKYRNWRQVLFRTLQLNLSRDIRREVADARKYFRSRQAYSHVQQRLRETIETLVPDKSRRKKLLGELTERITDNTPDDGQIPDFYPIINSREIRSPLWSFHRSAMRHLRKHGYSDARYVVQSTEEGKE